MGVNPVMPQLSSVAGSLTQVMTTMPAINSIGIARTDSFFTQHKLPGQIFDFEFWAAKSKI